MRCSATDVHTATAGRRTGGPCMAQTDDAGTVFGRTSCIRPPYPTLLLLAPTYGSISMCTGGCNTPGPAPARTQLAIHAHARSRRDSGGVVMPRRRDAPVRTYSCVCWQGLAAPVVAPGASTRVEGRNALHCIACMPWQAQPILQRKWSWWALGCYRSICMAPCCLHWALVHAVPNGTAHPSDVLQLFLPHCLVPSMIDPFMLAAELADHSHRSTHGACSMQPL